MKRALRFVAAILTLLALFTATVSADVLQEKTFVHTGGPRPTANTDTVTFWEAPTLNAGESYAPGKLTLQNASDDPTTMTLTKMGLPYEQKEQLDYLDALHLIIRQEDRVVYDGSYARLSEDPTALQVTLQPEESAVYTVTLSRPFTYTQKVNQFPIVAWTFSSSTEAVEDIPPVAITPEPEVENGFEWPLTTQQTVAAVCGLVGLVFLIVVIVVIIKLLRKRSKGE